MTNKIVLKKSSVTAKTPLVTDLDYGELALNYADGKLYYKTATNVIDSFTSTAASSAVTSVDSNSGDITATQLLTAIEKVDGTGSGLDADLLDGVDGSVYLRNNQAITTIGSGVTGQIWLDVANSGIGNSSGFRFIKANDSAGIAVTENTSDSTMYEFYMADNPDGGDTFSWRFTDWQGLNGLWQPLQLSGITNQYTAKNHNFYGNLIQPSIGGFYSTSNIGATGTQVNQLSFNTPSKLKISGTGTNTISNLNVSGFTGASGSVFSIKLTGTGSTFNWGYGSTTFTPIETGLSVSTSPVTLSNGIQVTFSSTSGGAVDDLFQCRVYREATNVLGTTTISSISTSNTITSSVTTGTSPLSITSTTLVTNLNADLLDGNHASAFYLATNPSGYTTNTGTVTSVGGTGTVSGLTLTGNVTTSGNLTLGGTLAVTPSNFSSQTAKTFLAAPNATAGVPSFRTIVASDVPTLNQNTTGSAGSVANALTIGSGLSGTSYNGSAPVTITNTAPMVYPGAGIPLSTGSAWGTSYSTTGTGNVVLSNSPTITGNWGSPDSIQFNTSLVTPPTTPGSLYWDAADGNQTLSLVMASGTAVQQIGEEIYYRIKASSAITNGQTVMFTGSVGASGALQGAPATGITIDTASYFMGVATQDIATNGWGYVTHFGVIRGIDTTGGAEAWVDGQILYYNPTVPGGLTKTLPVAPNPKIEVAAVLYAAANGSLFVRPTRHHALESMNNVETAAAATNDLLQYTASGYWTHRQPNTISGIGDALKWTTARTITLGGDLTGNVTLDGSANVTLTATVAANSVALGTDTTGNYVAGLTAGTGVSITGTAGEGWSPTVSIGQAVSTTSNVVFNSVTLPDMVNKTESATVAVTTQTQIASFTTTSFRSAKLIVQAYDSVTGEVQITELLVAHNGTTAYATEYGVVYTGTSAIVVFDVDISGGNVRLLATRTTTNSTQYKVSETLMVA